MKDYWLAKLISSVREVDSRKRLQKAIYLLQAAGCPLACDYILHFYGPYSFELAALVDQLDGAKLIEETPEGNRYRVHITPRGKKALAHFERTSKGKKLYSEIKGFLPLFGELNGKNLWVLELGATMAFFYRGVWSKAVKETATFKNLNLNDPNLQNAEELAKEFKKPT